MRESSTYQAILEEGREEGRENEAKDLLRLIGEKQLGPPDEQTTRAIDGIHDLARLRELITQVPTAGSWKELLAEPAAKTRRKKQP
ncbi:hypothetical protein [Fimbriiglobus ruber]|nr:hypothetical protein [Fimbriiglobus ruber]